MWPSGKTPSFRLLGGGLVAGQSCLHRDEPGRGRCGQGATSLLFDHYWGERSSYPNFRSGGVNPPGAMWPSGKTPSFRLLGGALVAGQSSPHRHEADGGGVTKGRRAFFLIIVGMAFSLPNFRSHWQASGGRSDQRAKSLLLDRWGGGGSRSVFAPSARSHGWRSLRSGRLFFAGP